MNKTSTKIVGLIFIFLGIGYLGSQFDWWTFSIVYNYFPIIIVALGIASIIDNGFTQGNVIMSGFGVYLFLSINNFIEFRLTIQFVIALILLYFGIKLVFFNGKFTYTKEGKSSDFTDSESFSEGSHIDISSAFSTKRIVNKGKVFSCRVGNTFGTIFLDLSEADLTQLNEMKIESMFGEVDILLPNDVNVSVKRDNIFGNCYVDETLNQSGKEIHVKESCIFGSIKIRKAKKNK